MNIPDALFCPAGGHCRIAGILLIGLLAFMVGPVCAVSADTYIEAELGDTINLHGVSYVGDRVYLFLTGPGLPENGVMLTDTSQRADQGHLTIVDLESDQTWSMKWDTSRIRNQLDTGTYYVYVSNEEADKSSLGGKSTYQILEVYFEPSSTSRVSVNSGDSYMLYPEKRTPTPIKTIVLASPTPTPEPTTEVTTPAPEPTALPTTAPTTKAPLSPMVSLIPLIAAACILRMKTE
jgi:hypothetical protein